MRRPDRPPTDTRGISAREFILYWPRTHPESAFRELSAVRAETGAGPEPSSGSRRLGHSSGSCSGVSQM